jgi:hypothetical protein
MPRLFLLILLIFISEINLSAQKRKKGKCQLSIVDSMSLSPSADLMFYWWDPYHLHSTKKVWEPYNVDQNTFAQQTPPYTYKFKLKRGLQHFSILSCFRDSVHFELDLDQDTTLYFQHLVKDYYHLVDSSQSLLSSFQNGDLITLYLARIYPDNFHALRLDFHVNEQNQIKIDLINRQEPKRIDAFDQETFITQLNQIEPLARKLQKVDEEHGYFVVIRKNKEVIEYKGKLGGGKISTLLRKLEEILGLEQ